MIRTRPRLRGGALHAMREVCLQATPTNDLMSAQTKLFVGITASLGLAVLCTAVWHWQSADLTRFLCYLAVAVLASGLKVQLPGIDGTMSVNFLFILLGAVELTLPGRRPDVIPNLVIEDNYAGGVALLICQVGD